MFALLVSHDPVHTPWLWKLVALPSQTFLLYSSLPKLMKMTQLWTWLKKHFRCKSSPKKRLSEKLACLPSTRRPLTPISLESPTCLFFELPADIRSIILTMAFGGRTLHIDIVRQNQAWQWRGAVCNRNPPGLLASMQYTWNGPLHDSCLEDIYERKIRIAESYSVGIMGFLLSCRQAYTEGIEFLYSNNCINIQSEILLLHLPQTILVNRLGCIKSLEIVIRVYRIQQDTGGSRLTLDHLKPILDHVVTHCPSLRGIYVSFESQGRDYRAIIELALPVVDAFHRSTRLRSMIVELPPEAYGAMFNSKYLDNHSQEEIPMVRFPKSLWRSLDGEVPIVQRRPLERYPYPPPRFQALGHENKNTESVGY